MIKRKENDRPPPPLAPPERLSELHREHRGDTESTDPQPRPKRKFGRKMGGRKIAGTPRAAHPLHLIFLPPHLSAPTPPASPEPSQRKRTIKKKANDPSLRLPPLSPSHRL